MEKVWLAVGFATMIALIATVLVYGGEQQRVPQRPLRVWIALAVMGLLCVFALYSVSQWQQSAR